MESLDLFKYTSYRSYLAAYISQKKLARKGWSYVGWARKIGVKSPATLAMIVNGQRNPGPELIQALCKYFSFGPKESQYFHDLVELEKNKANPRLTVLVLEKLSGQHPSQKFHFLDHRQFRAISNWHYYAIREMVRLRDFSPEPKWISKKLKYPVSVAKVRETIDTLLKFDLLKSDGMGKLSISESHVDTPTDVADEGLKRFHGQVLGMATASIRDTPPEFREVSGTTFSISLEKIPRAKELIREFRLKLCQLLEQPEADAVYQLEMAFFPLTHIEQDRSKSCH